MSLGFLKNTPNINYISHSKKFFTVSVLFIILSLFFSFFHGFNWGIDFKGGIIIDADIITENKALIDKELTKLNIKNYIIKNFDNNRIQISINLSEIGNNSQEILNAISSNISSNYKVVQRQFVGPSISKELLKGGIQALIFALIGIFVYLWSRFDWQYGLVAIITLIHDVLIAILFVSIFNFELNISSIAAFLTVIGYSINDTVVLFDQVRENVTKYIKDSNSSIINKSINQALSRSLSTSITLLLVLIPIFIFGGESLKTFSFILFIGVLFGTYSSICIATPMLNYFGDLKARELKKQELLKQKKNIEHEN
jgi:preprotein translocase subunit SecF